MLPGAVLVFRPDYQVERYGPTATVVGSQVAASRPAGAEKVLVDLVTANGTKLQWPVAWVRRDTVPLELAD